MRITSPLLWKGLGLIGTTLALPWIGTIDFKIAFYDPEVDPAFWSEKRRFILLFWHEHILCPLVFRRHSDVTMMLSRHTDAEIVDQAARLFGMRCIRGSSRRGGSAALKQFLELSHQSIMAVTPDGPRGPRRTMAMGPIFLASKLDMPIVLCGVGYDRAWRAGSWDRFVLPKPFCRGRMIVSPKLPVPPDLDKAGLEHFRGKFETLLTRLTDRAEAWAVSGEPIQGESIACAGPKCSLMYYGYNHRAAIASPAPSVSAGVSSLAPPR